MTEPHTTEKHLKFMKSSAAKENPGSPAALTLLMAVKRNGLKNRWLRAQAALAIGFVLQAGLAAAQNLVTNPGFETGDTTGWTTMGSVTLTVESSVVHSGTYACEVSGRTASWNGIAQSLLGELTSGQTYNFTAWVQLVSGGSQTVQVTIEKTDGSGTSYVQPAVGTATTNGWTQLSGQYTYNPSGTVTSLILYVEVPTSSTASYYVDDVSVASASVTPANGQCTVDWTNVAQRIDGFGASSAFTGFTWTTNMADMFFSTNNGTGLSANSTNYSFTGIGLSLLRSEIQPGGYANANEITLMQYAQARGAKVWSAPWSPQASFKSNGTNVGGTILSSSYQAYANQLAGYVANLQSADGISNFYALSIQNEPDATVSYVSCYWNAQQIHDFVPYLYNALVASNVGSTKIMLPESQNWLDYSNLAVTTMNDSTTSNMVGIIADHNYDGADGPGNLTKNSYGKPLWETEVSTFDPNDGSINNGVYWAQRIYLFMTQAQVNAYHFWWLINLNTDNEGLTDDNYVPCKRMYTMGQYSRFVRPGYYRVNVPTNTGSALVSAYKDPNSGNFAIVAINSSAVVVTQAFNFTNVTGISSVTPWITDAARSLSNQTPVAVSSSSFSYALPALSVVTFVGQGSSSLVTPTFVGQGITAGAGGWQLSFSAQSGQTYKVLAASDLTLPVNQWTVVTNGTFGSGAATITDNSTNTQRFYKIVSP